MTHIHRKPVHTAPAPVRAPPPAPKPPVRAPAPAPRPAARPVDVFEAAPRRPSLPAAPPPAKAHQPHQAHQAHELQKAHAVQVQQAARAAPAPQTASASRKQQLARTIHKELSHLPVSAHERKRLEQTALHPGHSQEDRRAARDLRRVLVSTRRLPPSVQEGMVKPFVQHPSGTEARAAASLTRRKDFRTAPTEQRAAMARVFPHTNPANVARLASATRQVFSAPLTDKQRQQVLDHAFSRQNDAQLRINTREVLQSLRREPSQVQAEVLRPMASNQDAGEQSRFARKLVHSAPWTQGGPNERGQLASVFGAAPSTEAHASLARLLQEPGRLRDVDARGGTLLSNLATLAKGPLHASLPASARAELLGCVLQETANPGEVNQSGFNSCTVTSMQYKLARDNPSEYARLMAGLTGPWGSVDMRGGGTLQLQPDSLDARAYKESTRSLTESIFQSAAMEFANGDDDYQVLGNPTGVGGRDLSVNQNPDDSLPPTYIGQFDDGIVRAARALFGQSFSSWNTNDSTRSSQLDFLRNYPRGSAIPPVFISFDANGAAPDGGHAVTFEGMSNDRVFFRNPWGREGANGARAGQEMPEGAFLEDPATGLYSFSLAQFQERVSGLTVPDQASAYQQRAVA